MNDCYFTIYKELFERYPDSDYFCVELVDQCDKKAAKEKMKRSVDLLVYITGIPYEMDYVREDDDNIILPIDIGYSREKLKGLVQ